MRQIGEQVKASNNRYLRIEEEVAALQQKAIQNAFKLADIEDRLQP
ncbi:MAG: hypothetical protein JWN44_7327 [Myxococcales bacterium]|nr:hypothetical protein [Myxococcales bacterium]